MYHPLKAPIASEKLTRVPQMSAFAGGTRSNLAPPSMAAARPPPSNTDRKLLFALDDLGFLPEGVKHFKELVAQRCKDMKVVSQTPCRFHPFYAPEQAFRRFAYSPRQLIEACAQRIPTSLALQHADAIQSAQIQYNKQAHAVVIACEVHQVPNLSKVLENLVRDFVRGEGADIDYDDNDGQFDERPVSSAKALMRIC